MRGREGEEEGGQTKRCCASLQDQKNKATRAHQSALSNSPIERRIGGYDRIDEIYERVEHLFAICWNVQNLARKFDSIFNMCIFLICTCAISFNFFNYLYYIS